MFLAPSFIFFFIVTAFGLLVAFDMLNITYEEIDTLLEDFLLGSVFFFVAILLGGYIQYNTSKYWECFILARSCGGIIADISISLASFSEDVETNWNIARYMNMGYILHFTGAYPEYNVANLLLPHLEKIRNFPELRNSGLTYGIVSAWELDALFNSSHYGKVVDIDVNAGPNGVFMVLTWAMSHVGSLTERGVVNRHTGQKLQELIILFREKTSLLFHLQQNVIPASYYHLLSAIITLYQYAMGFFNACRVLQLYFFARSVIARIEEDQEGDDNRREHQIVIYWFLAIVIILYVFIVIAFNYCVAAALIVGSQLSQPFGLDEADIDFLDTIERTAKASSLLCPPRQGGQEGIISGDKANDGGRASNIELPTLMR